MRSLTRRELVARGAVSGGLLALPASAALLVRLLKDEAVPPIVLPARAGDLPPNGAPQVAGIRLPRGRRWAAGVPEEDERQEAVAWITGEGLDSAFELAWTLATAFGETGLWPVLWLDWDDPWSYCDPPGSLAQIDAATAERVLAAEWSRRLAGTTVAEPFGTRFPGLAKPTGQARSRAHPFRLLEAHQRREDTWYADVRRPRLMLVPCRHQTWSLRSA